MAFDATQATYCPDDDAVCRECIAANFWTPIRNPYEYDARFCVGANGCVCISFCYITSVSSQCLTTSSALPRTPTPSPSTAPSPSPSPVPTQSMVVPTPSTSSPNYQVSDYECRYSASDGSNSNTYRSCRDCLTKKGCRISEYGYCASDAGADPISSTSHNYDFRYAIAHSLTLPTIRNVTDTQLWRFPASSVTYCPSSDPTCQQCIDQRFWIDKGNAPDSRFCVGASGCVCIANCVRADNASTCPWKGTEQATAETSSRNVTWQFYIVLIAAGVVWALIGAWVHNRRTRAEPAPVGYRLEPLAPTVSPTTQVVEVYGFYRNGTSLSGRAVPSAPPTPVTHNAAASAPALDLQPVQIELSLSVTTDSQVPRPAERPSAQLELYGWISHRQHLIDAETRRLNGADDFVPARNRYI